MQDKSAAAAAALSLTITDVLNIATVKLAKCCIHKNLDSSFSQNLKTRGDHERRDCNSMAGAQEGMKQVNESLPFPSLAQFFDRLTTTSPAGDLIGGHAGEMGRDVPRLKALTILVSNLLGNRSSMPATIDNKEDHFSEGVKLANERAQGAAVRENAKREVDRLITERVMAAFKAPSSKSAHERPSHRRRHRQE
jgi:hypothetical protein